MTSEITSWQKKDTIWWLDHLVTFVRGLGGKLCLAPLYSTAVSRRPSNDYVAHCKSISWCRVGGAARERERERGGGEVGGCAKNKMLSLPSGKVKCNVAMLPHFIHVGTQRTSDCERRSKGPKWLNYYFFLCIGTPSSYSHRRTQSQYFDLVKPNFSRISSQLHALTVLLLYAAVVERRW